MLVFLVDRNLPGVEIADNWDVLGMRATESHDLILNDVKVPLKHLVETEKSKAPNGWILHIPSCYLGIAQAARNYAVDFAIQHSPNSIEGTIATLPTVQQNLGKMETLLLCARQFYGVQQKAINNIQTKVRLEMRRVRVK